MSEARDRLAVLEAGVQRALDLLDALRAENQTLRRERAALDARIQALVAEVAALRESGRGLERLSSEHARLLDDRRQLLGQIEGILKELNRIEGL
jgi:FtsZ-binding cell division protein ZapB